MEREVYCVPFLSQCLKLHQMIETLDRFANVSICKQLRHQRSEHAMASKRSEPPFPTAIFRGHLGGSQAEVAQLQRHQPCLWANTALSATVRP